MLYLSQIISIKPRIKFLDVYFANILLHWTIEIFTMYLNIFFSFIGFLLYCIYVAALMNKYLFDDIYFIYGLYEDIYKIIFVNVFQCLFCSGDTDELLKNNFCCILESNFYSSGHKGKLHWTTVIKILRKDLREYGRDFYKTLYKPTILLLYSCCSSKTEAELFSRRIYLDISKNKLCMI